MTIFAYNIIHLHTNIQTLCKLYLDYKEINQIKYALVYYYSCSCGTYLKIHYVNCFVINCLSTAKRVSGHNHNHLWILNGSIQYFNDNKTKRVSKFVQERSLKIKI